MWGNRLGWGISAVIVIVVVGLIALLERTNVVTPQTAFSSNTEYFAEIRLPVDPRGVIGIDFDNSDAAPKYRQLIDAYQQNESVYQEFFQDVQQPRNHPRWKERALPGLTSLLDATENGTMDLFASRPEEIVHYKTPRKPLVALTEAGRAAILLGLIHAKEDPARAKRYYEAVFSLGYKLYNERVVYEELDAGLSLMSSAAVGLAKVAEQQGDKARAEELLAFDEARKNYWESNIKPIQRIISSIDNKVIAVHPGDLWALAKEADERMWRVEATLKLGRQRYNAARAADQRAADRQLTMLQDDDDPAVKIAATKGKELTIEEYRMLK